MPGCRVTSVSHLILTSLQVYSQSTETGSWIKKFAQSHSAIKWMRQDSNPGLSAYKVYDNYEKRHI